jgi:hypothetical protein
MCHKKLIQQYPKSYWQSIYSWLMLTDMPDWLSGRIFEWTWHYILTQNPIDKKYENSQILLS